MKTKTKIKRGKEVVVITGSHKGKSGKVLELVKSKTRAIIEGVALKKKHVKATQDNPNGGIVERETSIHISNIMLAEAFQSKKNKVN